MKDKKYGQLLTILLTGTNGVVLTSMIIPVLAYIAQEYPQNPTEVSMLMTLPSLIMIPTIVIVGKLAQYIGKKELCIFGTLLYVVGGVAGGIFDSIHVMLAFRAIMGIGGGILFVVPNALVAQLYEGKERAAVMGYMGTAQSILQIAAGLVAGFLGVINWRYCFYGYGIFFLFLLMQLAFIPKLPPDGKLESVKTESKSNEKFGLNAWMVALILFVIFTTGSVFNLNISTFVVEGGFGSSIEAGYVSTISAISTIVFTALFGKLFDRFKIWLPVIIVIGELVSYIIAVTASNIAFGYVAAVVFGIMPLIVPYAMTRASMVVPESKRTMGMSLMGDAIFLGQFASTPFLSIIRNTFGEGYVTAFKVTIGCLIVVLVLLVVYTIVNKKKLTEHWSEQMAEVAPPQE